MKSENPQATGRFCIPAALLALSIASGGSLIATGDMTPLSYDERGKQVPRWSGDALASIEDTGLVHFFDATGREVGTVFPAIPGASETHVRAAAHHPSGAAALCGVSLDSAGRAGNFLALVSAGGATSIVRTNPYSVVTIAIAPDGTIWTAGGEAEPKPTPVRHATDAGVIRHFDTSGKLLGSFIPQSSVPWPALHLGFMNLAVSATRAGWFPGTGKYYEISFDGTVQQYPAVPSSPPGLQARLVSVAGLALTDAGDVFASAVYVGGKVVLYTLDRSRKAWNEVQVPPGGDPPARNLVLGGSGDAIVFETAGSSAVRFLRPGP